MTSRPALLPLLCSTAWFSLPGRLILRGLHSSSSFCIYILLYILLSDIYIDHFLKSFKSFSMKSTLSTFNISTCHSDLATSNSSYSVQLSLSSIVLIKYVSHSFTPSARMQASQRQGTVSVFLNKYLLNMNVCINLWCSIIGL